MSEVTLLEILNAREKRVKKQEEFLARNKHTLICFTMNIAGPLKVNPLIERAFYEGVSLIEEAICKDIFIEKEIITAKTGFEAFFSVYGSAEGIKEICVKIEEETPLGRLFDIDVLDSEGHKLERKNERACLVCGKKGRSCSAGRIHSVDELQKVTRGIMYGYFFEKDRKTISDFAHDSLLEEVLTSPKPGLVDARNNGSHSDMDIFSFITSANAIAPHLYKCVEIGQTTKDLPAEEVFEKLREAGLAAEHSMLDTTGGVNTHKGAIYSFGVLCGAVGRLWTAEKPFAGTSEIFAECQKLVKESTKKDFENIDASTAGGRIYLEHGLLGIRGEVADGFPSVLNISLPAFEEAIKDDFTRLNAGVFTLLHLIANVDDTTLYKRGGLEGIKFAKEKARELLAKTKYPSREDVEQLDDIFIEKNLSPGGCADLLAVTYFIGRLRAII